MGLQTSENIFGAADKFTRAGNLDYNSRAEGGYKIFPTVAALNTWVAEEQARQRLGPGFGAAYNGELCRVVTDPALTRRQITITGAGTGTAVVSQTTVSVGATGWVSVELLASDTAAQNLAKLNAAATQALTDKMGLLVWSDGATLGTLTWTVPLGVPVQFVGPHGRGRILTEITNGAPVIQLTLTAGDDFGHVLKGLWVSGGSAIKNAVAVRACGEWLRHWEPNTTYAAGARVCLGNQTYIIATPGTSGATGPTGTGANIPDGGAFWNWQSNAFDASETVDVSRSVLDVKADFVECPLEAVGWMNDIQCRWDHCTSSPRLAFQNGSVLSFWGETTANWLELHSSAGFSIVHLLVQGAATVKPGQINNCHGFSILSYYAESSVADNGGAPFMRIGNIAQCNDISILAGESVMPTGAANIHISVDRATVRALNLRVPANHTNAIEWSANARMLNNTPGVPPQYKLTGLRQSMIGGDTPSIDVGAAGVVAVGAISPVAASVDDYSRLYGWAPQALCRNSVVVGIRADRPGLHQDMVIRMAGLTTNATVNAGTSVEDGTAIYQLLNTKKYPLAFRAWVHGVRTDTFLQAVFELSGAFLWDGTTGTGVIYSNGGNTGAASADPIASTLEVTNDLGIVTAPTVRLGSGRPRIGVTGIAGVTISWTARIELLGGIY